MEHFFFCAAWQVTSSKLYIESYCLQLANIKQSVYPLHSYIPTAQLHLHHCYLLEKKCQFSMLCGGFPSLSFKVMKNELYHIIGTLQFL